MSRYSRQELFLPIGPGGQERLRAARVVVAGCGALGSSLAETLVRAGAGTVTVVDRDFVEETNLQRQSLFEEEDARQGQAKAAAAARRLSRINSDVSVRGLVADITADNVATLLSGATLVLDGTDNFETRYLLNDVCLRERIPWVYGACVGSYGLVLPVRPGVTPCLRCVLDEKPPAGSSATCDTAGVIAPIVQVVAGLQAAEALKLLTGNLDALLPGLATVDVWRTSFDVMDLGGRAPWCPACTDGRYDYADARPGAAVLCGRDAVQLPAHGAPVDLPALAARLAPHGRVVANANLVRFVGEGADLAVFADGRAIVKNVRGVAEARSLFARYVGA